MAPTVFWPTRTVPAGICVSPPRVSAAVVAGRFRTLSATLANFWAIALPDGEPRIVMAGISRAGLVPPSFSWLPDNRHVLVTRSDGLTPGNHLWVVDTKDTTPASSSPRPSSPTR